MKICGLNKTTLLDYPGKVACTIFLGGCNLRCPFCQNGSLVLHPQEEPEISREEIFTFLKKRQGILDGVCITGGEPTLAEDLPEFLSQIRELGYRIKLDTNGTRPQVLRKLLDMNLLDMIAMDIKAAPLHYSKVTGGAGFRLEEIEESIKLIMSDAPDYEFRTTVVRGLHTRKDFEGIAQWIAHAKACYLQAYRDSDGVIQPGFSSYTKEEMEEFAHILQTTIPLVEIRGMD